MARTRAELELLVELKDEASRGMDKIAKKGGFLKDAFAFATGGLITAGISKITNSVGDMFGTMFGETMDAQQGMAQLEAVIKSTGGSAGLTAKEVLDLSSSLSSEGGLSRATDDAVLGANNMLLTFTRIGKDVFPTASQAVLDMATAMGNGAAPTMEELQSKAVLVGKALNDPIKGITALTRVGVTFTDEQKATIKSLMETNDVAGAQKIILEELGKEFGGSALASTKTFGGQMDILRGQFEKSMQALGEKLMPKVQEFLDFLNSPEGQEVMQTFIDLIGGALSGAIDLAVGAFNILGPIVTGVVKYFKELAETGDPLNDFLTQLPDWLQPIVRFLGEAAVKVGEFISAVSSGDAQQVKKFWEDLGGPIGFVGGLITDIALGVTDFIKGFSGEGSQQANQFWIDLKGNVEQFTDRIQTSQTEGRKFWDNVLNVRAGETPFEASVRLAKDNLETFNDRVKISQEEGTKFWNSVIQTEPGETPFEASIRTASDNLDTFKTRVNDAQTEGQEFWNTVIQIEPGETPFEAAIRTASDNLNTFKERVNDSQTEGQEFWSTVIDVKPGETPFEAAISRANEMLTTWANNISQWGIDLVNNFVKGVNDVWNKIVAVGSDIIEGVKKGITDSWSTFVGWVKDKFGGLVQGIMDAIQGGSPAMLYAPVGSSIVQGVRKGIQDEWQQFEPVALDWFDQFVMKMKLRATLDETKGVGTTLMDTVRAGASEACAEVSAQVDSCIGEAIVAGETRAGSPEARTPGQMIAWSIRDGILDEQDQVYDTFSTFWDGLWGIAADRSAEIQELINNTIASGSASSAGTGVANPNTGGPGGGGGQVMDRGGIVMSPTRALLAANHQPEAVIPLNKLGSLGTTINVTINAGMGADGAQIADAFVDRVIERIGNRGVTDLSFSRSF